MSRFGFGSRGTEDGTAGRKGTEGIGTETGNGNGSGNGTRNGSAAGRTVLASTLEGCATPESLHRFRNRRNQTRDGRRKHNDLDADAATTKYRCGGGSGTELGTLSQSLVDIRTEEQGTKLGGFIY